jgi:NADPH2:quinone reductase
MLFSKIREVRPGDTVFVHAAAGGLGLILVQWAKALGARVIGTVGSREKQELALAHGLDYAILYREQDFVRVTKEFTDGAGVEFAIDGIGGQTFVRSLELVKPFGTIASVGWVEAPVPTIDPASLGPKRSIMLSLPSVFGYASDVDRYREGAIATLERFQGNMKIHVGETLHLSEAGEAHRRLERGATSGSIILIP